MRSLIVYESMFGNTKQIAEAIGEGLREKPSEVTVVEVSRAPRSLEGFDLIVVGGPTHAWSMSRTFSRKGARDQAAAAGRSIVSQGIGIREWLRDLAPTTQAKAVALFDTSMRQKGWFPFGSAAKAAAKQVEQKGMRLITEPQQFRVTDVEGPLEPAEVERAHAWGLTLSRT